MLGEVSDTIGHPGTAPAGRAAEAAGDKLHEACGVFGAYAPGADVANLCYLGIYALQHRGQESAGICV
ncbi:hypothetical protein B1B_19065, partial [mine drainage metagenome]